jgi:hypothetical protein
MLMMKSRVVDQLSVVNAHLVQNVDQNICEKQSFKISELSCEFPKIACTVLYEIITVMLGCLVWCKMSLKNAYGYTQNAENGFLWL